MTVQCQKRSVFLRLLLPVLLVSAAGCQSSLPPARQSLEPVQYDQLYGSRLDDSYSSALYHFAVARLAGMDGDIRAASEELQKAVQEDPGSVYLKLTLAEVYLHLDQDENAFRVLEDALIQDPDSLQGHLLMANILSARNDLEGAIRHLGRASEIDPENERILMQLAMVYNRAREMDKSIAVLKGLVQRTPDNIIARLALARIYRDTDLPVLAEQVYREILDIKPDSFLAIAELGDLYAETGHADKEETLYLESIRARPADIRLRHRLASRYIDRKRYDDALEQIGDILRIEPGNQTALRKAGLIYLETEDWLAASGSFEALTRIDPDDEQAYYYLGIAREGAEQWPEALVAFGQIDSGSSLYADALIHRAYNLHNVGRTGDAVALIERNRELLSDRPEIYDYLSFLYADMDQTVQAIEAIEAGLGRYPEDNTLLFRRIVLLDQSGDAQRAEEAAKALLRVNPDHVNALNFLAYSYAVRNIHLEEALQLVNKALAIRDEPYIRDTLGWVLYRLGRFEDALVELQRAVDGLPRDPVVLEHLGDVYRALGRTREALSIYRKAVPEDGTASPELQEKMDALGPGNR